MSQVCYSSPFVSGGPPVTILNQGFTDQDGTLDFTLWWQAIWDKNGQFLNDDDYIKSDANFTTRILVTRLAADNGTVAGRPLNPLTTSNCILKVRTRRSIPTDPANYSWTRQLRQDYVDESNQGLLIATLDTGILTDVYTLYTYTLTTDEVNSITNWPNIYFRDIVTKS